MDAYFFRNYSSQTYEFIDDVFQRRKESREEEENACVKIKTDKANKFTGGLLNKFLTKTEYAWSWCIWHERKCVKKMFAKIFAVGKMATKVKYLYTKQLSRKTILGLFIEQNWPPPGLVEGTAPPVEIYRAALQIRLREAKECFSTMFKTAELAATYTDLNDQDRAAFRERVGDVRYCTNMDPSEEETKKQWWTKLVQLTYRDRDAESKAASVNSWLYQNEKKCYSK